jgi:hypothetical protein
MKSAPVFSSLPPLTHVSHHGTTVPTRNRITALKHLRAVAGGWKDQLYLRPSQLTRPFRYVHTTSRDTERGGEDPHPRRLSSLSPPCSSGCQRLHHFITCRGQADDDSLEPAEPVPPAALACPPLPRSFHQCDATRPASRPLPPGPTPAAPAPVPASRHSPLVPLPAPYYLPSPCSWLLPVLRSFTLC